MDSAGSSELNGGFGGDTPGVILADLASVLDRVNGVSLEGCWDHEVQDQLAGLEVANRRIDATRVAALGQAQRSGLHQVDGHASAKVMVRRSCRLSGAEALRRERQEHALRHLTLVADAYRAGTVGTEQVDLVARVFLNTRVRDALIEFQPDLLILATECNYPVFEQVLRQWERAVDTEGPEPKADTAHKRRSFSLTQDPENLAWTAKGSLGPLQGAKVHELLRRLADRERDRDWAEAKAKHGDNTCAADLERTEAQRWADALVRMADMATSADPDAQGPGTEHIINWHVDTYLATVHRVTCTDPACSAEAHASNRWYDPATYRCETLDGHPLEPVEAVLDSFHHHVRVVLVTGGQPTHVGSRRRLFTGRNRLAVKLKASTCVWGNPSGCWLLGAHLRVPSRSRPPPRHRRQNRTRERHSPLRPPQQMETEALHHRTRPRHRAVAHLPPRRHRHRLRRDPLPDQWPPRWPTVGTAQGAIWRLLIRSSSTWNR